MTLQIKRIIEMSPEIAEPVGALTLLDRETWADVLPLLIKGNQYHRH